MSRLELPPAKRAVPNAKGKVAGKGPEGIEIAPAPESCNRYVKNKAKQKHACETMATGLELLDAALGETEPVGRDAKLAALETCAAFPAGMVRALRADLAPAACADVLVLPVLGAKNPPRTDLNQLMTGLALAARLRRAATSPPKLDPPFEKQRVAEFINGPMKTWMKAQATAIEAMSKVAAELSFYARGIAAIEAGMADMRIVEVFREAPIPEEYSQDPELRDAYFASLEQALDDRKTRGRDATLVGLKELATVGTITDERVARARALLSKLFGGRRIDMLDALVLPAIAPQPPTTMYQRLAARLPTYYAGLLLAPDLAKDPGVLRQLMDRGVPVAHRRVLHGTDGGADVNKLMARFRLTLGTTYWRTVDFDEVTALAASLRGRSIALDDEASLLLAVALALRGGPEDAADMMVGAPVLSLGMGKVDALDAIAHSTPPGPFAGTAALDAAIVLQVSPPGKVDQTFWKGLAQRYREAAAKLTDPAQRRMADERAQAAEQVAAAVK